MAFMLRRTESSLATLYQFPTVGVLVVTVSYVKVGSPDRASMHVCVGFELATHSARLL